MTYREALYVLRFDADAPEGAPCTGADILAQQDPENVAMVDGMLRAAFDGRDADAWTGGGAAPLARFVRVDGRAAP